VSASAREYVLRERNCIDRGKDRVEFYRSLLPATARDAFAAVPPAPGKRNDQIIAEGNKGCKLPGGRAADIFARLCNCAGAGKTGRHLLLSSTRYELLLLAGILASDPSNPSKAWNMFLEAIEIEPSLYMPYLFGAFVSNDPVQTLKNAIERNPCSIVSWIHLGRAYLSKGMGAEAIGSFKAAAGIFPGYELPYIECANCLKKMGFEQEAIELLKKAIDLIPGAIKEPAILTANNRGAE
jgi:tetratricopeptide (TPR) repeat protein